MKSPVLVGLFTALGFEFWFVEKSIGQSEDVVFIFLLSF
jgi:hypothetical protein